MEEFADELGIHWRTAYRIIDGLREAGVTVEVSRERDDGAQGAGAGYYSVARWRPAGAAEAVGQPPVECLFLATCVTL